MYSMRDYLNLINTIYAKNSCFCKCDNTIIITTVYAVKLDC